MNEEHPKAYLVSVLFELGVVEGLIDADESIYWVEAVNCDHAMRLAGDLGRNYVDASNKAFSRKIVFVGITEVMPVYESPEHGAQLGWRKRSFSNRIAMREEVL